MSRRNLVIVRAGDRSLHDGWLGPLDRERSWDLVVSYFGNDPGIHRRPDVQRIDGKGTKWAGLHALLAGDLVDWRAYDHIWLPDDDLAATPEAIERLFTLVDYHALHLAQPSLSHDSYISHAATVHNPRFLLRRTNFVEVMAPMVSREMLQRVLPTMIENESGWGLDFLWQMFLDRPRRDAGVVDTVQIRHTRPVGGPNYAKMREQGKSPFDELEAMRRKYCLWDVAQICWSGITADGAELALDTPGESMPLLSAVLDGMRAWLKPAELQDVIGGHLRQSAAMREAAAGLRQQRVA